MYDIVKLFIGLGIVLIILTGLDMIVNSNPRYKRGDCAKSLLFPYIRKIQNVKPPVYNYCILVDNNVCGKKQYSMKINDFDRIMAPIKCNGEKL